jgi:hypothetical protein
MDKPVLTLRMINVYIIGLITCIIIATLLK